MKYNLMDQYYQIAIETQNDWFSSKEERPWIVWADVESPPILVAPPYRVVHSAIWSRNINDLYWTLNQAHIHLSCAGKDRSKPSSTLNVALETVTPYFEKYLVKTDKGPWRKSKERFRWRLKQGMNTSCAKPVNKFGREGITSSITVRYV